MKFDKPVRVAVGLCGSLDIRSLMDIHRVLTDWPHSSRTSAHANAVSMCEAAREGFIRAARAKRAFIEFAKTHDILWPEFDTVVASQALDLRGLLSDI